MVRGRTNNPAGNPASLAQLTPEQRELGRQRAAAAKRAALSEEFGGMPYEQAHALRLKYYQKGYETARQMARRRASQRAA